MTEGLRRIRARGCVPLAILFFDPQKNKIGGHLFHDIQDLAEANALLEDLGLVLTPTEKDK